MDATIRHTRRGLFGPAGALVGGTALAACGAPGGIEAQPLVNGMIGDVMLDKKSIRDALQETEARVQAALDAWKR